MRLDFRPPAPALAGIVLAFALALTPGRAAAQFSAIPVGNILENAPVFTQSAVVHERGGASLGGYFAWFLFDEDEFFGEFAEGDVSAFQLGGGAAFGLTDRITLGATVPYLSVSVDTEFGEEEVSGIGDVDVFGRAQLWRSRNRATRLAALASVTLPTADDEFFLGEDEVAEIDRSPDFSFGGAVSHDARRASVHGALEYTIGGDLEIDGFELEGVDVLSVSGAAVFAATDRVRLSGEFQVDSYRIDEELDEEEDDDAETALAGGLRYLASPNLFLDGGVILPVSDDAITAVLFAGLTWTR